ncbi:MAG TPA: hypothetical protein VK117_08315, partial [Pyrinomonadaceae bacterium]|nr:hypothetical protein [Pyrinomonadaceae bacterium]
RLAGYHAGEIHGSSSCLGRLLEIPIINIPILHLVIFHLSFVIYWICIALLRVSFASPEMKSVPPASAGGLSCQPAN